VLCCKQAVSSKVNVIIFIIVIIIIYFMLLLLFFQSDENEDEQLDSKANKLNLEQRGKKRKYLFKLTLVNSYGSNDVQALEDNSKPLKLTGWQAFCLFFFLSVVVCLSLPLELMSILDKSSWFVPLLRTSLTIIQFGEHIAIYKITKIVLAL